MLGSLRPVAAQASFCAPGTAAAVVLALIVSSPVNAAEYRYTDYGPYRYDSVTSFPGFTDQQEPRFSTIGVGAAYKF
jgi:hypothetical protein